MKLIDAEDIERTINSIKYIGKDSMTIIQNREIERVKSFIQDAPTIEAFTREELENWLYTICYNNIDGNEEDMKFAKHTEEIIRRLDGFERYVKDKREGKI